MMLAPLISILRRAVLTSSFALAILFSCSLTPAQSPLRDDPKRQAVIEEFANDPMLFSTALVIDSSAEVTSGTLSAEKFTGLITNFFVAVNSASGSAAQKITAIYDASPQVRTRLQAAARRIRAARRQAVEAEAVRRKEEEDVFRAEKPQ